MSENEETNETAPAAPAWMATQAPKIKIDKDPRYEDGTLVTPLPKTRKPRRTKAQMLADAAARPDAERVGKAHEEEVRASAGPGFGTVDIATTMAAEDHRDAVVRDTAKLNYPPRINRTWYERHGHHVPLAVAIVALILAIVK